MTRQESRGAINLFLSNPMKDSLERRKFISMFVSEVKAYRGMDACSSRLIFLVFN